MLKIVFALILSHAAFAAEDCKQAERVMVTAEASDENCQLLIDYTKLDRQLNQLDVERRFHRAGGDIEAEMSRLRKEFEKAAFAKLEQAFYVQTKLEAVADLGTARDPSWHYELDFAYGSIWNKTVKMKQEIECILKETNWGYMGINYMRTPDLRLQGHCTYGPMTMDTKEFVYTCDLKKLNRQFEDEMR